MLSSHHHNRERQDLVAVSIYGQPVAGPWDLSIEHWREAGLRKPSKSVCDNISTVFQDTLKPVGHIDTETLTKSR